MKPIILSIALLASVAVFAGGKASKDSTSSKWDTLRFKNEMAVDVSPLLALAIGSINEKESVGLTYKRYFTKRDALRVGVRFRWMAKYEQHSDVWQLSGDNPVLQDSLITIASISRGQLQPDLRLGYEHAFGRGRVKWLLGADVLVGYRSVYEQQNGAEYRLQTSEVDSTRFDVVFQRSINQRTTKDEVAIGVAPFTGLRVFLSKRFSFTAYAMYDFSWGIPVRKTGSPGSGFELGIDALVTDVSFCIHF